MCNKIRKFQMATIFRKENFFEIWKEYLAETPWRSKILTKSLYLVPLRRSTLCFVENWKIQNGRHFSKEKFLFEIWAEYLTKKPWRLTISMKSLFQKFKMANIFRKTKKFGTLGRVRRYKQFCVFAENSKR